MISGKRLNREEACRLWDLDLLALGQAAAKYAGSRTPEPRITYTVDRKSTTPISASPAAAFAPFRPPGAADGYVLSLGGAGRGSSRSCKPMAAAGFCSRGASTPGSALALL